MIHSGGEGTVTVDGDVICSTGWEATDTAEWVDVTQTCDYDATDKKTYTKKVATSSDLAFSFEGFAEDDNRVPLLIRAGQIIGPVILKLFDDGGTIEMNEARVISAKLGSGGPKGVNTYSLQCEANGKFSWILPGA